MNYLVPSGTDPVVPSRALRGTHAAMKGATELSKSKWGTLVYLLIPIGQVAIALWSLYWGGKIWHH